MQDIDSILDITQKYHAFFHTDAIQALGRVPMSSRILDAHFITLCGHKIGGPMGIGLLILPETHFFTPLITGGGQQKGIRSGTENYPAIIGFAQALEEAMSELNTNKWSEVENLRDYLETSILKISPTTFIAGKNTKRLPNTSLLSMPDVESMTQVIAFDLEGIAVSAGSACSSGTVKPSDGLKAMQIPDHHLNALLRVSLGVSTTKAEIDHFISIWSKIYQKKHQTDSQEDITYAKRHF
jgi:cysteine desulfurase